MIAHHSIAHQPNPPAVHSSVLFDSSTRNAAPSFARGLRSADRPFQPEAADYAALRELEERDARFIGTRVPLASDSGLYPAAYDDFV